MTGDEKMTAPYLGNPKGTIEVLQKYDFVFQKKYGQNFLIDTHVLDKIIDAAHITKEDFVLEIASGIGLSRSAFFKKLKSLTGLAPVDLVKEIRLNKSIELIKNTDLSVSEVAFAVGFKDSGYYSKCFRKKYNQTPREYMNEWRKG